MGNVKRLLAGIFFAAAVVVALAPAASAASMVEYALLASPDATAIEYGL
ncbi:hypothetical protein [Amycolatopsis sp. Hca4]|nr:hypothetical protein [Amycolatopsis sp. Hca4]QKV76347.1 hypothetical protein HUT10_23090 [Amycolatopsis sp. Hca4]